MATQQKTQSARFKETKKNAKMATIEKMYGKDLGVQDVKKYGDYLEKKGMKSLGRLLGNKYD